MAWSGLYDGSIPQQISDLNMATHWDDSRDGISEMSRGGAFQSADESITAYFTDIEHHLIEFIGTAEIIVGCVAWVTSKAVLDALALKVGCGIIIQKEDFLRPDTVQRPDWARWLRSRYERVPGLDKWDLPYPLSGMGTSGDMSMESFRCAGLRNGGQETTAPRCHHKFILACHIENVSDQYERPHLVADAVWTGSYNFTVNASRSLENALVVNEPNIAAGYLCEWAAIAGLSEPLDWQSEWVAPEWRIGT